jgi:protein-L-isoaspartate(D-aspartate) O-methyltransferase
MHRGEAAREAFGHRAGKLLAAVGLALIILTTRSCRVTPTGFEDAAVLCPPTRTPTMCLPTSTFTLPVPTSTPTLQADPCRAARKEMVDSQMRKRDITDERVLEVMEQVPRQEFVPEELQEYAFIDRPLPIGYGQTISQPYIVAVMTQLLEVKEDDRVLEVGTGSGYQAAIMGELAKEVYTVEIIEPLASRATELLERLGYTNIHVRHADGYYGWEEHAPYNVIVVTCAPDHIPQPLLEQLADGGRLAIPVGPPGAYQSLWKIERKGDEIISRRMMGVQFVPLTGEGHRD